MIPVVTPAEMRAIDAAADTPVDELIGRAGRAVARSSVELLGGTYGRVVTVIAGGGNNGADGRVAGEHLRRRGALVRVVDALACPAVLPPSDLVIDAAFGTGFRGSWAAPDVGAAAVVAVDIPSGVDASTGEGGPGVLPADRTVTFQALKPGLLFGEGAALAGDIEVADIGLDASRATAWVVERDDVASWWPTRAVDAHKWRGAVRIVAGSTDMPGAGELCATAAARAGAGLVSLSSPGAAPRARSEVLQPATPAGGWAAVVLDDIDRFGALVVGPGLGRAETTIEEIRGVVVQAPVPVVIDGDGLFALAWSSDDPSRLLAGRRLATVLTPHDGEFAVLTGRRPGVDRIAEARRLAATTGCVVLLKGPTTVVAEPDGEVAIVANGDQRLATAGSGDVLAGMIGAALAAGAAPGRAAAAAAWLHAEAGRGGPSDGLLAGDLAELLPAVVARIR